MYEQEEYCPSCGTTNLLLERQKTTRGPTARKTHQPKSRVGFFVGGFLALTVLVAGGWYLGPGKKPGKQPQVPPQPVSQPIPSQQQTPTSQPHQWPTAQRSPYQGQPEQQLGQSSQQAQGQGQQPQQNQWQQPQSQWQQPQPSQQQQNSPQGQWQQPQQPPGQWRQQSLGGVSEADLLLIINDRLMRDVALIELVAGRPMPFKIQAIRVTDIQTSDSLKFPLNVTVKGIGDFGDGVKVADDWIFQVNPQTRDCSEYYGPIQKVP